MPRRVRPGCARAHVYGFALDDSSRGYAGTASFSSSGAYVPVCAALFILARSAASLAMPHRVRPGCARAHVYGFALDDSSRGYAGTASFSSSGAYVPVCAALFILARSAASLAMPHRVRPGCARAHVYGFALDDSSRGYAGTASFSSSGAYVPVCAALFILARSAASLAMPHRVRPGCARAHVYGFALDDSSRGYAGTASFSSSGAYVPVCAALFILARSAASLAMPQRVRTGCARAHVYGFALDDSSRGYAGTASFSSSGAYVPVCAAL